MLSAFKYILFFVTVLCAGQARAIIIPGLTDQELLELPILVVAQWEKSDGEYYEMDVGEDKPVMVRDDAYTKLCVAWPGGRWPVMFF